VTGCFAKGVFELGMVSVVEGTLLDFVGARLSGEDCLSFAGTGHVADLLTVVAMEDLRTGWKVQFSVGQDILMVWRMILLALMV
jgi:hypothetical protein